MELNSFGGTMKKNISLLLFLMISGTAYGQFTWLTKFAGLFKGRPHFLERRRAQRNQRELKNKQEVIEPLFSKFYKAFNDAPTYVFPKLVSPIMSEQEIAVREEQLFENVHKSIQDNALFCPSGLEPAKMTREKIDEMLDKERTHFVNSTKIFFGVRKLVEVAEKMSDVLATSEEKDRASKTKIFQSLDTKLQIAAYSSAKEIHEKVLKATSDAEKTMSYSNGILDYRKKCLVALEEAQQE